MGGKKEKNKSFGSIIVLIWVLIAIIIYFSFIPKITFSASTQSWRWEVDYPFGPPDSNQLPDYILTIYKLSFWVGTFLAVLMIIIGGVQWMSSAASPQVKMDAKDRITKSIIGLILLFAVYIILYSINPELTVIKDINLPEEANEEMGFDAVETLQAPEECEANSQEKSAINIKARNQLPLCGNYCFYFCTGDKEQAKKMKLSGLGETVNAFPDDFWETEERSKLGLDADFGYTTGHDPGSGKDVAWCGCYRLPDFVEEVKRQKIEELLKKEGKNKTEDLSQESKDEILDQFGFRYLGTHVFDNLCESLDTEKNNCKDRCGTMCFHACRQLYNNYGDTVFGVLSSWNAGSSTDLVWCDCYQGPKTSKIEKEDKEGNKLTFDFHLSEVITYGYYSNCGNHKEKGLVPQGQPCEAAGTDYPRCGQYCYQYCKARGYKFGVISAGFYGAGLDEAYCTCFK